MDRAARPASGLGPAEDHPCGEAEPIGPAEFARLIAPVISPSTTGLVIAVSGGPDSVCLMRLLADHRRRVPPLTIATVDHGLRSGSPADAAWVLAQAEGLGLPSHVLTWEGPKPSRAIQERARLARYALLTELCRERGASHLLTAHTLDDQAETVLFRMARGSGIAGLAGMSASVERCGIVHARPLLGVSKARLVLTCMAQGWPFLSDASNQNPRFARARLRKILPILAAEGLDATRLGRLALRAARAETALSQAAQAVRRAATREAPQDAAALDGAILARQPAEIVVRVLGAVVEHVGGRPTRLSRLECLAADLTDALASGTVLRRTLNGTRVVTTPEGSVTIRREGERRRGSPRRPDGVHRIGKEADPLDPARRGSLGNGGADAYIEHRRNAATSALSFRVESLYPE